MTSPDARARGSGRRWLRRGVLTVSLALNLLVVGVLAGALWQRGGWPPEAAGRPSAPAYLAALEPADRAALREGWRAQGPDMRRLRAERRNDMAALVASLRAEPFDPASLEAALAAQASRLAERQALSRALLAERVAAMTPAERAAYADRLQAAAEAPPMRRPRRED